MATLILEDLLDLQRIDNGAGPQETVFHSNPFYVKTRDINIPIFADRVRRGEEMRMDKLVWRLHDDLDHYEDFCLLNRIFNPFSIREGQLVLYTTKNSYQRIRDNDQAQQQVQDQIRRRFGNDGPGSGGSTGSSGSSGGIRLEDGVIRMG